MGIDAEQCWDVKHTPQAMHGNSRERTQPLQNFKVATFVPEDKPASIEMVMGASRDNIIGYLLGGLRWPFGETLKMHWKTSDNLIGDLFGDPSVTLR